MPVADKSTTIVNEPTWVATDIDGTFLTSKHTIDDKTAEAYGQLTEHGIPVIPSTGRSLQSFKRILRLNCPNFKMKITPGIYLNGSVVYGETETDIIHCKPLPMEAFMYFLDVYYSLIDMKHPATLLLAQGPNPAIIDFDIPFWYEFENKWCEEIPEKIIHRPLTEALDYVCCQVSVIGPEVEVQKLREVIFMHPDLLARLERFDVRIIDAMPTVLAALTITETKARGLCKLAARYPHLDPNTVMTIGDGNNDVEMLQAARWSFAMGQAPASVKAAAKRITLGHDEGGWAAAMRVLTNL